MWKRCHRVRLAAAAVVTVLLLGQTRVLATENISSPTESMGEDVAKVSLPIIMENEESPFDFIIDPQKLLFRTDAARYGGGRVEEGATLLFYNREGDFDFSSCSDLLTITNQGTGPVLVTITARITELGEVRISDNMDFSGSNEACIYLAIEDAEGNVQPLSGDGEASVSLVIGPKPYSFGLAGASNPNGDWQGITVHPTVTVTWHVEPAISEGDPEDSGEVFTKIVETEAAHTRIEDTVMSDTEATNTEVSDAEPSSPEITNTEVTDTVSGN